MRHFEIDLLKCKLNNLLPDEYVLLYLLYYKDFLNIEKIFTREYALELRNKLTTSKYILSNETVLFKETVLSNNVKKLFNISDDIINFWEWYNIYPPKFEGRIFRASDPSSKTAKEHEKKYLSNVKTLELHNEICKRTKNFIALKKEKNELQYLYQIDTVLNNRLWEQWDNIIPKSKTWNQEII